MPSMVHSSVMTLVMAGEEQPVFHDFLGIGGRREDIKQPEVVVLDIPRGSRKSVGFDEEVEGEASTRASSINSGRFEVCSTPVILSGPLALAFPSSSDPGSEHLSWGKVSGLQHHGIKSAFYRPEGDSRSGKKRDISNSTDSLQDQLQMSMEALDNSRFLKVSRLERNDERKNRHQDVGVDDLHLTMQPPRKCPTPLPSSLIKTDFSTSTSKKWDCSRPVSLNTGTFGPTRIGHISPHTEKLTTSSSRDNTTVTPLLPLPPADEGSRTGLKGSGAANLLNSGSATPARGMAGPTLAPGRSKLWSQNAGSESTFVSCQQTTAPTSRQLTIFYGGQAHVFDDVPPDKAEAIMALAGSSGRSWSTIYSPRPKASLPLSASEGSLSAFDREREKTASKASAINGFSSLALSSEIHNALSNPAQMGPGGSRTGHHANLPEGNFGQLTQWSTAIQTTTDRIGSCSNRQESREVPLVHTSTSVGEAGKEFI